MVLPGGGVLGDFADFAALQATLNSLPGVLASNATNIRAYNFSARVGPNPAVPVSNYTWIQDSITSYSSSDLLFQTAAGGFGANAIVLV
jgi:hypothetical protein